LKRSKSPPRINLIRDRQRKLALPIPAVGLPALLAVAALIIGIDATRLQIESRNLGKLQKAINAKEADYTLQLKDLNAKKLEVENRNKQLSVIAKILERKINWSDVFKELSMMTPKNIWLVNLKATQNGDGKREMFIQGSGESSQAVSSYFQSLEQSYFFKKVMIVSSTLDRKTSPTLYRFKFQFPVSPEVVTPLKEEKK